MRDSFKFQGSSTRFQVSSFKFDLRSSLLTLGKA